MVHKGLNKNALLVQSWQLGQANEVNLNTSNISDFRHLFMANV